MNDMYLNTLSSIDQNSLDYNSMYISSPSSHHVMQHNSNSNSSGYSNSDDYHHILQCKQMLSEVRYLIVEMIDTGKTTLSSLFNYFDTNRVRRLNAYDWMSGLSYLNVNTTLDVSATCMSLLASTSSSNNRSNNNSSNSGGGDRRGISISFSDFKLYVRDINTSFIMDSIQSVVSSKLINDGISYYYSYKDIFNISSNSNSNSNSNNNSVQYTTVDRSTFLSMLKQLDIVSEDVNVEHLLIMFDTNGNDEYSIDRLQYVIESSKMWKDAITESLIEVEAIKEGEVIKQIISEGKQHLLPQSLKNITASVIDMAIYLGIRVSTDINIIWIAEDALRAPLPIQYTMRYDNKGRIFYHNTITNVSTWQHPFDAHFRKIRESYRDNTIASNIDYYSNILITTATTTTTAASSGKKSLIKQSPSSSPVKVKLPDLIDGYKDKIKETRKDIDEKLKHHDSPMRTSQNHFNRIATTTTTTATATPVTTGKAVNAGIDTGILYNLAKDIYDKHPFDVKAYRTYRYNEVLFFKPSACSSSSRRRSHSSNRLSILEKLECLTETKGYMGRRDDVRAIRPTMDDDVMMTKKERHLRNITRYMYSSHFADELSNRLNTCR